MDDQDMIMPYHVPTDWKGNAAPKELLVHSWKVRVDTNLRMRGVKLFEKREGLPCEVCKLNRAWLTLDPYDLDIHGKRTPRHLCESCEDDIAADI